MYNVMHITSLPTTPTTPAPSCVETGFFLIRAYSCCKALWLLLILALLCASWSGLLGFPALLHAVLMLSGVGILSRALCRPLYIAHSESQHRPGHIGVFSSAFVKLHQLKKRSAFLPQNPVDEVTVS